MVTFLRKLFIKDYKNIGDPKVRTRHGVLASIGGIIINLLLFVFKIVIGIITASMSIISDAINNLTDLLSCFVNLIGFKMASKPADSEHPYGHERIEYIAGMIISFIIICVALLLGYTSIMKLVNQEKTTNYEISAFIILGVAIVFKIILGLFYRGIGKAINSVSLKASMQDSLNDAISTGVVLIAALIQYFYNDAWYLDAAMSLVVALFIFINGIKMVKETASPLIGISPSSQMVQDIINEVKGHKGILGVHDVICHSYGPTKLFITLHAEVDGYANMFDSHEIIDNIESEVNKRYGAICTIHMDPIDTRSKELKALKPIIEDTLISFNEHLSFHDLRIVTGKGHSNIIFDVVIPMGFNDTAKLLIALRKEIRLINPKYNVVINVDHDFTNNN